jgi:putative hydrolase of the HAD superfamily
LDAVLVFDADNTLWDTNAVFRRAQLDLLRVFVKAGYISDEASQFEILRTVDRKLSSQLGCFEYDFGLLSAALAHHCSGASTIEEAVSRAIDRRSENLDSGLIALVDEGYRTFQVGLRRVPTLYPDAASVLSSIRAARSPDIHIVTILFSEGNPARLEHILQAHEIRERSLFDEIILGTKSVEAFEAAKLAGLKHLPEGRDHAEPLFVMTGDSLLRDIKYGNQAGFVTIYKPASFLGRETPREKDERPDIVIRSLSELPSILKDMGVPVNPLFE